jgi:hypothetical protein
LNNKIKIDLKVKNKYILYINNMAELEYFKGIISDKSVNTQKSYITQYKKLYKLLEKDIGETSQKKLMDTIKDIDNANSRQALLNIGILIRTDKSLDIKDLLKYRETLSADIKTAQRQNNIVLQETLPSYNELVEYLESLEGKNDLYYIINYLLVNYNVRNEDLHFKLITRKKEAKDTNFNYIWLSPRKVEYIRNVYKTAGNYGQKLYIILDKPFASAVRRLVKANYESPTIEQMPYIIKKATLLGIGEAKYNKIIVNHYRDNIDMLKQISERRGTSLTTLLDSYDIGNKD